MEFTLIEQKKIQNFGVKNQNFPSFGKTILEEKKDVLI